jgi:choloylglycine hydrolase
MNEKGLAVEEMSLDATKLPQVAGRASMSQSQWIQYQLDEFATVDEVVRHLDDYNLTGWGWHFTVGDATGACAIIEFIDGKPAVVRPPRGAPCVQTNDTQAESQAYLRSLRQAPSPKGASSLARFVRLTRDVAADTPVSPKSRIAGAFEMLRGVSAGKQTIRTTVHDMTDRKIYFRTVGHPQVKSISLKRLDFSSRSPVRVLELYGPASGDVTNAFVPYTRAANRKVAKDFYDVVIHPIAYGREALAHDLAGAHMTETQFLDLLAAYPETLPPAAD